MPELLVVSGIRPPHLWGSEHDADEQTPAIAELPAAAFWKAFKRRYGVHPDLDDADFTADDAGGAAVVCSIVSCKLQLTHVGLICKAIHFHLANLGTQPQRDLVL